MKKFKFKEGTLVRGKKGSRWEDLELGRIDATWDFRGDCNEVGIYPHKEIHNVSKKNSYTADISELEIVGQCTPFDEAKLKEAIKNKDSETLFTMDFTGAKLDNFFIADMDLRGVCFVAVKFNNVYFDKCIMNGEIESCKLEHVIFDNCDFRDCTISVCLLTKCKIINCYNLPSFSDGKINDLTIMNSGEQK